MCQYNCEFVTPLEFPNLKDAWNNLERGKDMTYYQTYEWFEMLLSKNKKLFFKNKVFLGIVKDISDNVVLIAPVFIKTSILPLEYKKGVYFFGMGSYSDYSNFIYNEVNDSIFNVFFQSIVNKFSINVFYFEYLQEHTKLYEYIIKSTKIEYNYCSNFVGLYLPDNLDDYNKLLSKNVRQNIRTAYNRLSKDGVNYIVDMDNQHVNVSEFEKYRNFRIKKKNQIGFSFSSIKRRILQFYDARRMQTTSYHPYRDLKSGKFLTVIDANRNVLMSAVNYGYSENRKEIVAMCVSLNEEYKKYSPGIIGWYHFIVSNFGSNSIKYVDFTRGNESYKFALGGKPHYVHFMKFFR